MAPKKDVPKQEDVLQAVVIADSFNRRFGPITRKKPRTLLPVVNVPLLDYTLAYLNFEGVKKTYVVCRHLADQIRTHIKKSKWNQQSWTMSVETVVLESDRCFSLGDALREMDQMSLLKSHFILIYGDVVSNLPLRGILEEHRTRCETVKTCVMTMIYKETPQGKNTRDREDNTCLACDPNDMRLLHRTKTMEGETPRVPTSVFEAHEEMELRNNVQDTFISVCSPLVPQLFTDNFDYQTLDHFVKGVISHEELLGNTIHIHYAEKGYAVRVSSLHMYDAVSRDVMRAYTQPFSPDSSLWVDKVSRRGSFPILYLGSEVNLAMSSITEGHVVIGADTTVGKDSRITNSVIGKNCIIGDKVQIRDSYLWDNVVVQDGCVVDKALLCSHVTVHPDTSVNPYSVLSWNVQVGPSATIPGETVLVDAIGEKQTTSKEFGAASSAEVYKVAEDEEEEEDMERQLWHSPVSEVEEVFTLSSSEDETSDEEGEGRDEDQFFSELMDTMTRAKEENILKDNLILEINSLKHAYNIAITDVNKMVVQALVVQPLKTCGNRDSFAALREHLTRYRDIMKNYIKTLESELDCLAGLEELCEEDEEAEMDTEPLWQTTSKLLAKLIHLLYEWDIVSEQAIHGWFKKQPSPDDDGDHSRIRKPVEPLITWLMEAEEESDEDEDEEDGE